MSKVDALTGVVIVGPQMIVGTLTPALPGGAGLATEVVQVRYAAASELADFLSAVATNLAYRDGVASLPGFAPRGLKPLRAPAWAEVRVSTNFRSELLESFWTKTNRRGVMKQAVGLLIAPRRRRRSKTELVQLKAMVAS